MGDVAEAAAHKVARRYTGVTEYDDVRQDANLLLATNHDTVRRYLDQDQLGLLHRWLWCRLTDQYKTHARHRTAEASIEQLRRQAA
ncbi:hypothetical protein [Pilimelia terevasa]|uniref:hypothetical protein n=1 Tax=Pilimelia terevasa TaxID=53372 RepID=UPI0016691C58|nr:hypothetical protein [Pilimelia terevasa]